jgi:DNA-binding response OmpR family regulator
MTRVSVFPPPQDRVVLIAEPDAGLAAALSAKLRLAGVKSVVAPDGFTALALALTVGPKAVVTELDLPFLPGVQLCERLRAHPQTSAAMIVAVTRDEVQYQSLPTERGFDAYLSKPYYLADILRAIDVMQRVDDDTAPGIKMPVL